MKSKSKSKTPVYQGPPNYLLDSNRKDPFADAANICLSEDGTFRPINGGAWIFKVNCCLPSLPLAHFLTLS